MKLQMPNEGHSLVTGILLERQFDRLIGMKENLYLEVKGPTPYDFSTPSGRFELAKDVSAFANSEGGHLLIGFEHERLPNERADEIKGVRLFKSTVLNPRQLEGLVNTHVWPTIVGLTVDWIHAASVASVGIVSIYIPAQREEHKFFLVTKVVEAGESQKEIIVGIARRVDDDNIPLVAQEIHDLVRRGRDTVLQRSIRIEEKLDALLERSLSRGKSAVDSVAILEGRLRLMRER
jgi:predicted HTH transcriptional regulator